jgi:hypothetical protein
MINGLYKHFKRIWNFGFILYTCDNSDKTSLSKKLRVDKREKSNFGRQTGRNDSIAPKENRRSRSFYNRLADSQREFNEIIKQIEIEETTL